jgi:RHS repeat-associated protein
MLAPNESAPHRPPPLPDPPLSELALGPVVMADDPCEAAFGSVDPTGARKYYRARYYDPAAGRFISEDPIRLDGGVNLYAYVKNRPVNLVDPLGLWGDPHHQPPGGWKPVYPPPFMICFVKCSLLGSIDDLGTVGLGGLGLIFKPVRNWVTSEGGKHVLKCAGEVGLAAASVGCTLWCASNPSWLPPGPMSMYPSAPNNGWVPPYTP